MSTRDISRGRTEGATDEVFSGLEQAIGAFLPRLLAQPSIARGLSDVDDPLEGCDRLVKSITYGRVGDPAGTHTREQCKAVTMMAFGYLPEWPREWMGSAPAIREDGEDEGHEVEG